MTDQQNGPTPDLSEHPVRSGWRLVYAPETSPLTLDMLYREITHARELTDKEFTGMREAMRLTQTYPTIIDTTKSDVLRQVGMLEERFKELLVLGAESSNLLYNQKFATIAIQLADLKELIAQATAGSKEAINAAFKAAGDATQLQAQQTKESFAQLTTLFTQANESTGDKISALDRRMTTTEGRREGGSSAVTIGFGVVAAVGVLFGIAGFLMERPAPPPQIVYTSSPPTLGQPAIITPIAPK